LIKRINNTMSGNKTDNGVHEVGTDEIRLAYQNDTPGQDVEGYIREQEKSFHEQKNRSKKHFSQVFQNPLDGYPYNESITVRPIKEDFGMFDLSEGMKMKDIMRKHGRELKKAQRSGNLELSKKAEDDLMGWVFDNEPSIGDDPDDFIDWLDMNLDDIVKGKIKEGFKSDAQRRAAFASGYKAKGKKGKKEEVNESKDVRKKYKGKEQKSVDKLIMQKGVDKVQQFHDKNPKEFDKMVKNLAMMEELKTFGDIELELNENEKGLKNKAEKSGISLSILKQVYDRGLAAYKTGHRPGATAPQWAMARVNSFITKGEGTWGKADKDLADKVRGSKK